MNEVNNRVGVRLLNTRARACLSLAQVEEKSNGAIKASALGSYERGDRTLSLPKLFELARFYNIDPASLIEDIDPYPEHAKLNRVRHELEVIERLQAHIGDVVTINLYGLALEMYGIDNAKLHAENQAKKAQVGNNTHGTDRLKG